MRTTETRDQVTMPIPASRPFQFALSALNTVGSVQSGSEETGILTGLIGSGALGMNPAELIVQVSARTDSESYISLLARAEEGLINQHTGPKAIAKFLQTLQAIYNARTFALPTSQQPLPSATQAPQTATPPPLASPAGPAPTITFRQTAKWMLIGFGLLFLVTFLSWKAVIIIGIVAGVIAALRNMI